MSDRGFSHPNLGTQARVELIGKEVRLTFVCSTHEKAADFADALLSQMKAGALNLTLMGKPSSVEETEGRQ